MAGKGFVWSYPERLPGKPRTIRTDVAVLYVGDEAEKQAVTAAAVEHCRGRSKVYVGTGAETTREVVRLTKMAEAEGADGVSVITPYFIKPTQPELIDHFKRVAEATKLPVVLYNNPATCGGVSIEPDTVAKLAEVPNVVGLYIMAPTVKRALAQYWGQLERGEIRSKRDETAPLRAGD